jgi:hypothetical protein
VCDVVGSVTVSKMQNLTFLYNSEEGTSICKSWIYKSVNVSSNDMTFALHDVLIQTFT